MSQIFYVRALVFLVFFLFILFEKNNGKHHVHFRLNFLKQKPGHTKKTFVKFSVNIKKYSLPINVTYIIRFL